MSTVPSRAGCQSNRENSSPQVLCQMLFLLQPQPVYLGLGPAEGTAGFGPLTFELPMKQNMTSLHKGVGSALWALPHVYDKKEARNLRQTA